MMSNTIKISPPNSILFISDSDGGETPNIDRSARIWSTSSSVAFACLMEQDGKTEVTIGPAVDVARSDRPTFDGEIETPNRIVVVATVEGEDVLKERVRSTRTRVRLWTNHPTEPDRVIIGLD